MENPMGRFIDPTSEEELQRRWDAVREVMREQKIDYLVMQNQEEFMGGSLRWFTAGRRVTSSPCRSYSPWTKT